MSGKRFLAPIILLAAFIFALQGHAQFLNPSLAPLSASNIPEKQQIQPAELVQMLTTDGADRPLILQVGSQVMFAQAHIPDSVYAGPGSQATGLQGLEKAVASTPKGRLIVIYCGCCPWNRCPNMGPAYKKLHDLGFTNVKALHIAKNFGDDWVAKGYPAEKGE